MTGCPWLSSINALLEDHLSFTEEETKARGEKGLTRDQLLAEDNSEAQTCLPASDPTSAPITCTSMMRSLTEWELLSPSVN